MGRRDSDLADRIELQQEMREDDPNYREEEEDDPVGFGSRKFTKKHLDDDDEDGAQLWQPMGQAGAAIPPPLRRARARVPRVRSPPWAAAVTRVCVAG